MTDGGHTIVRTVIRWVALFTLLLLLGYLALLGTAAFVAYKRAGSDGLAEIAVSMLGSLQSVVRSVWEFARPLLQLLVVLSIVDWILKRMGIQLSNAAAATTQMKRFSWDVQAIIAVIVISAYAVAQLAGMGGEGMKDIALVVVGFYFGTQRRSYEVDPQTGKMRVIEDHTNTLADQNPSLQKPGAQAGAEHVPASQEGEEGAGASATPAKDDETATT